jgi:thioredoxin reductase (NADPH)
MSRLDCAVIGGGPAGLTAAIYLARFGRRFIIFDTGESRADWIPATQNYPGFPHGISGRSFLASLVEQALKYGADMVHQGVSSLEKKADAFVLRANSEAFEARTVILATGVAERAPPVTDLPGAARKGLVRICPICDGYECVDKGIVVISDCDVGVGEALFLRRYSNDINLLWLKTPPSPHTTHKLIAAGISVAASPVAKIGLNEDGPHEISLQDGTVLTFDVVYSALGVEPRHELALQVGAKMDNEGRIVVDLHQRTSVAGLFAAGDLVRGLNQLTVATSEGAIAATSVHNLLREGEGLL